MNFTIISRFSRSLFQNLRNSTVKQNLNLRNTSNKQTRRLPQVAINYKQQPHSLNYYASPLGLLFGFSFLKKKDEDETPEEKLIMTIKRSILSIHRKEYDKAEQMLHIALRMAQDLNNRDGITYVYDVLANLAMERQQFERAEKLFTDVMRRLLAKGETEDSLKIIHISSKIAHMAHLQENYDKATQGFKWVLEKLKKLPDSDNLKDVKAVTLDWYGRMLIDRQNYREAMQCFHEAYDILVYLYGEAYSELIPILNNLSVAALGNGNSQLARDYINQALVIIKKIPEATIEGVLQANLGLIYLRDGMVDQAKSTCAYAYRLGRAMRDEDSVQQANYCLKEIDDIIKNEQKDK